MPEAARKERESREQQQEARDLETRDEFTEQAEVVTDDLGRDNGETRQAVADAEKAKAKKAAPGKGPDKGQKPKGEKPPGEKAAPKAKAKGEDDGDDEDADGDDDYIAKPDKKTRRRLARLTRQREDANRTALYWKEQARLAKEQQQKPADKATKDEDELGPEPKEEDFQNPRDYDRALARWEGKKGALEANRKAAPKGTETPAPRPDVHPSDMAEARRMQKVMATWQGIEEIAIEKYGEDFAEAIRHDIPMPESMLEALVGVEAEGVESEDLAAAVANHLVENPELAEEIAKLSPAGQARRIDKLAKKLAADLAPADDGEEGDDDGDEAPAKRPDEDDDAETDGEGEDEDAPPARKPAAKVSKAPKPIVPLKGSRESAGKDPGKMTQAEYEAWRRKGGGKR